MVRLALVLLYPLATAVAGTTDGCDLSNEEGKRKLIATFSAGLTKARAVHYLRFSIVNASRVTQRMEVCLHALGKTYLIAKPGQDGVNSLEGAWRCSRPPNDPLNGNSKRRYWFKTCRLAEAYTQYPGSDHGFARPASIRLKTLKNGVNLASDEGDASEDEGAEADGSGAVIGVFTVDGLNGNMRMTAERVACRDHQCTLMEDGGIGLLMDRAF